MYHINSASLFFKKKNIFPHITYQKTNNIVLKFVYSLLFLKIYKRTGRFGINNKLHFDFIFTNWRHNKSNLVLPTPTKNKLVEQPIKKIIPEIDITQQQQQQQQQQLQLQNEQ